MAEPVVSCSRSSKRRPVLTEQQEGWYQLKELSVSSTVELLNAFCRGEGDVALGVSWVSDTKEACCVWSYKPRCH